MLADSELTGLTTPDCCHVETPRAHLVPSGARGGTTMLVNMGLLLMVAAAVAAVAGVATRNGSTHPLGHSLPFFGSPLNGRSAGHPVPARRQVRTPRPPRPARSAGTASAGCLLIGVLVAAQRALP